ncbi:MAG: hypothetical protein AAF725_21540, partial [Acidobacteriota bacterium]
MSALAPWLEADMAQQIVWALVHFTWQGAAIALLCAGLLGVLGAAGSSARTRYGVAVCGLVAMACAPVLTVLYGAGGGALGIAAGWTSGAEPPAEAGSLAQPSGLE